MPTPIIRTRPERWLPWVLRAAWVGVLWSGGSAIDGATADRSDAVAAVGTYGAGAVWLVGVAAMAVPAVVSLTAVRMIVPLAVPAAVSTWVGGADDVDAAVFVAIAALAAIVAFSADLGRAFIQASAYGDEDRHPLRPPFAYALVAGATWSIWAASLLAGPLSIAAERYVVGGVLTVIAAAGSVWAWPRWHRLSRRWFVLVPVGVVVHDHLVLAETLMLRRQELRALRLAPADTDAADMTGPAAGHAIEVMTNEPVTAILATPPRETTARVIHLTGCLVSPSRPGRLLRAAGRRRLPVG